MKKLIIVATSAAFLILMVVAITTFVGGLPLGIITGFITAAVFLVMLLRKLAKIRG